MLRDRRLRHPQPPFDLADRPLRRSQQAQDRPPIRVSDNGEGGFHAAYILVYAYNCQAMFQPASAPSLPSGNRLPFVDGAKIEGPDRIINATGSLEMATCAANSSSGGTEIDFASDLIALRFRMYRAA